MELHKALRNIIQTDGPEILKEVRLVNILDDFNAYQDIPASKYILRAIISDGFTSKLLILGKWNIEAEKLAGKFAALTGFIPVSVFKIFLCMAYGLGWADEVAIQSSKTALNNASPSQPPILPQVHSSWDKNMSEDEKEQFLLSIVDFDHSREQELNIYVENLSINVDKEEHPIFSFEYVRRCKDTYGRLNYAIYDLKKKLKESSFFYAFYPEDINHKPVVYTLYGIKASDISKIRLFWSN